MKEHDLQDRERQPDVTPKAPERGPSTETGLPIDKGGLDREVGDIDEGEAGEDSDDGALPGRVGGGLAGG